MICFCMKIGIDASRYSHKYATGVEWYSYQIINGILSEALKHPDVEVLLYSPTDIDIPKEFEHPRKIRKIIIPFKRFWTLIRLSWEMRKNPPDVLFVPSHTLPLMGGRKNVITWHDAGYERYPGGIPAPGDPPGESAHQVSLLSGCLIFRCRKE